jgi:hypothetical protein
MANILRQSSFYATENELNSSYTQPADKLEPAKQNLIQKVWGSIGEWISQGLPTPTTASPIKNTYVGSQRLSPTHDVIYRRYTEPRARQNGIAQIRAILTDNALIYAAWKKFSEGALGTGFKVIVSRTAKTGFIAQREGKAQRVVDRIIKKCKLQRKAVSWARWLVAEGDLFIQQKLEPLFDNEGEIIGFQIGDLLKMPSATMERCTDDTEQFIDPRKAYIQRDIATNQVITTFAEWQILHARNDHEDGVRYGNSLFFPIRIMAEKALEASIALAERRKATAPTIAHILGKPEQRVSQTQMDAYKADVSKLERANKGTLSPYDEIFVTGGDVKAILTDANLDKVDDIHMHYDIALAPTGVSRQLLGSGMTVNRDILDEQRGELYAAQRQLADLFAEEVFKPIFDFGLLLAGIDPETVTYHILFKQRFTESQYERRIDRAIALHAEGCMSTEDVCRVANDYMDYDDPQAALNRINLEKSLNTIQQGVKMLSKKPSQLLNPGANGKSEGESFTNKGQRNNPVTGDFESDNPAFEPNGIEEDKDNFNENSNLSN